MYEGQFFKNVKHGLGREYVFRTNALPCCSRVRVFMWRARAGGGSGGDGGGGGVVVSVSK